MVLEGQSIEYAREMVNHDRMNVYEVICLLMSRWIISRLCFLLRKAEVYQTPTFSLLKFWEYF